MIDDAAHFSPLLTLFFCFGIVLVLTCVCSCRDIVLIPSPDLLPSIPVVDLIPSPDLLPSIPVVDFNTKDYKDDIECVICLSDLVDGDKAKLLPNCTHWFHAKCIDEWLLSHSTCPTCRKSVGSVQEPESRTDLSRVSSPVEDTVTQDVNSGHAADEHRAEVVIDIPASVEIDR